VGQPILAAAGFQPASASREDLFAVEEAASPEAAQQPYGRPLGCMLFQIPLERPFRGRWRG